MSSNPPTTSPPSGEPEGDPWAAFGYLVAGVGFYGVVGYGISVWLDAAYWLPIGILVGAAFGMYMVFARYRFRGEDGVGPGAQDRPQTPIDHDRSPTRRTERDDRGDSP